MNALYIAVVFSVILVAAAWLALRGGIQRRCWFCGEYRHTATCQFGLLEAEEDAIEQVRLRFIAGEITLEELKERAGVIMCEGVPPCDPYADTLIRAAYDRGSRE